jgi:hypothetical protein
MKNVIKVALLAAGLFVAADTQAQVVKKTGNAIDTTAKKVGKGISKGAKAVGNTASDGAKVLTKGTKKGVKAAGKGAKTVGNKTAQVASKGASAVKDKKYDGMVAPGGQTVYIDKNSAYYFVDAKGHHVYVRKAELVAKP